MLDDNNKSSEFKVVDKRTFSEDGTRREEEREKEKPGDAAASPLAADAAQAESFSDEYQDEGPAGFDTLVSYLSTTAMFQLGLLPGPAGERIPVDLTNSRRTIDLLEVLQEKTQGNLTAEEAKILEDVLFELRLTFVEVQKRASQKTK
jgi:hypothetical protein